MRRGWIGPRPLKLLTSTTLLIAFSLGSTAEARDCPNTCSGYLFAVGDTLELGGELRAFYLGISVGGVERGVRRRGDMPTARLDGHRVFENNVFIGLRPLIYWYPVDSLTIAFEHEMRFRWPGWEENVVPGTDFAVAGLDHRPTTLFIEWESSGVTATGGLQPFSFGSSAVLDQRFMGARVEYSHRVFNIAAFGGMTMRNLMRNAGHSMWMSYISATNGWKFTSNDPTENWAVGLTFSLKVVRPFRLQLLYLYSNPTAEHLESHALALHFAGSIVPRYLSFMLEPLFLARPTGLDGDADYLPGVMAQLRARLGDHELSPGLTVGGASSFLHDDDQERRFTSIFENLSWGTLQRFNLEQGHLFFTRIEWEPLEQLHLYTAYTLAFPDGTSSLIDELDAGAWVQVNDLYRLNLSYIGINLASLLEPSHAIYAELRIVIGQPR